VSDLVTYLTTPGAERLAPSEARGAAAALSALAGVALKAPRLSVVILSPQILSLTICWASRFRHGCGYMQARPIFPVLVLQAHSRSKTLVLFMLAQKEAPDVLADL
jgi:hypothetical protein